MIYKASTIALAFVKMGIETALPLTQMKLQKVLYFAQGIHLILHGQPLFEEHFQAWKYGPVIPQIYHDFKFYGSEPIADADILAFFSPEQQGVDTLDVAARHTLQLTWDNTKHVDAIRLSNWTHKAGSPWYKHYVPGATDTLIPNADIAAYFSRFVETNEP